MQQRLPDRTLPGYPHAQGGYALPCAAAGPGLALVTTRRLSSRQHPAPYWTGEMKVPWAVEGSTAERVSAATISPATAATYPVPPRPGMGQGLMLSFIRAMQRADRRGLVRLLRTAWTAVAAAAVPACCSWTQRSPPPTASPPPAQPPFRRASSLADQATGCWRTGDRRLTSVYLWIAADYRGVTYGRTTISARSGLAPASKPPAYTSKAATVNVAAAATARRYLPISPHLRPGWAGWQ